MRNSKKVEVFEFYKYYNRIYFKIRSTLLSPRLPKPRRPAANLLPNFLLLRPNATFLHSRNRSPINLYFVPKRLS